MPTKTRIIIVSFLILLGGVLFSYCAFFYPVNATQAKSVQTTASESEATPVKETSSGNVEQDKSEQSKQAPSERKPRPKAGAI